ncbi:hypothetical protein NMY22_g19945 [Coprinellus aureogranulatus]|nr:hypothetical protein NMY22_g19945 [Coprinellus aureogranulatus]
MRKLTSYTPAYLPSFLVVAPARLPFALVIVVPTLRASPPPTIVDSRAHSSPYPAHNCICEVVTSADRRTRRGVRQRLELKDGALVVLSPPPVFALTPSAPPQP